MDKRARAVWFHRVCAIGWALAAIPAYLWWKASVLFVIVASIYANVKSDWGAAAASDDREVLDRLDRVIELSRRSPRERDVTRRVLELWGQPRHDRSSKDGTRPQVEPRRTPPGQGR